jgi:hypothetical protein
VLNLLVRKVAASKQKVKKTVAVLFRSQTELGQNTELKNVTTGGKLPLSFKRLNKHTTLLPT